MSSFETFGIVFFEIIVAILVVELQEHEHEIIFIQYKFVPSFFFNRRVFTRLVSFHTLVSLFFIFLLIAVDYSKL